MCTDAFQSIRIGWSVQMHRRIQPDAIDLSFPTHITRIFWFTLFWRALYFSLSLLPSFSAFLASFFFSLAGHLVGFIFMGKVFRNTFRVLELDERKGRLVVEQDFHWNFQVNVTSFFASFSGVLDWIVLILVWFERSLHSAPVSSHKLSMTIKTDDVTSSRSAWTSMGGYGRLRGKWVNKSFL